MKNSTFVYSDISSAIINYSSINDQYSAIFTGPQKFGLLRRNLEFHKKDVNPTLGNFRADIGNFLLLNCNLIPSKIKIDGKFLILLVYLEKLWVSIISILFSNSYTNYFQ